MIDNVNGKLIKTAGYPGGASGELKYGTVKFLVNKTGTTTVEFLSDSLSYSESGENKFALTSPVTFVPKQEISKLSSKSELNIKKAEGLNLPSEAQVFDIESKLEKDTVYSTRYLTISTKGKITSNIDQEIALEYSIKDASNDLVFVSSDNVLKNGDFEVKKKFDDYKLPTGAYSVNVKLSHGGSVIDDSNLMFEIIERKKVPFVWVEVDLFVIYSLFAITAILFLIFLFGSKEKIRRIRKINIRKIKIKIPRKINRIKKQS